MLQNSGAHSVAGLSAESSMRISASCTASMASSRWRRPASAKRNARGPTLARNASSDAGTASVTALGGTGLLTSTGYGSSLGVTIDNA
ncbi:hypothetical protein G6F57_018395 [Rhizopus arrhizus]|nr:hypothetical protein G6F57_018395 [Rhizopus arrhizus]